MATPAVPGAINVAPPLTGLEIVPIANGGTQVAQTTTAAIAQLLGASNLVAYGTNAATAGTTLTTANVDAGGLVETTLNMTGTLAAGANAQLPTVAALGAAQPTFIVGMSYKLRIINSSSGNFAWTVTTNTGWTLNGTMTVAQNTWRDFYITFTSATAATIQSVGTGTNS